MPRPKPNKALERFRKMTKFDLVNEILLLERQIKEMKELEWKEKCRQTRLAQSAYRY